MFFSLSLHLNNALDFYFTIHVMKNRCLNGDYLHRHWGDMTTDVIVYGVLRFKKRYQQIACEKSCITHQCTWSHFLIEEKTITFAFNYSGRCLCFGMCIMLEKMVARNICNWKKMCIKAIIISVFILQHFKLANSPEKIGIEFSKEISQNSINSSQC